MCSRELLAGVSVGVFGLCVCGTISLCVCKSYKPVCLKELLLLLCQKLFLSGEVSDPDSHTNMFGVIVI